MGVCVKRRRLGSRNNLYPNLLMNYLLTRCQVKQNNKSAYDKRRGENRQHLEPGRANWFEMAMEYLCSVNINATADPYLMLPQT